MFGLTFEKLFLVAIIAGVVIGPERLPLYAHKLGETVRALRGLVETSRAQVEAEMGVPLQREQWESLDLRQYDPRRIVREALEEPVTPSADQAAIEEEARRVRPGQTYLVTGSAAHPRRTLIASLPADDPRRIAAEADEPEDRPEDAVPARVEPGLRPL